MPINKIHKKGQSGMKYYVSMEGERGGTGTEENPFQRIGDAAAVARAGDEVIVAPGIYREYVNPRNGGCEGNPIVYRSLEPGKAVITGAEIVTGWKKYSGSVWKAKIHNGIFGEYNPYTTEIFGDWYFGVKKCHTGEVYLNGNSLYEAENLESVMRPEREKNSWDPEFSMYKWYTEQEDGYTVIYANFHQEDPNENCVEINVRRNCFLPSQNGVNYIRVSGFVICQAATTWAPPTAYQDGMVGPNWSKGWIIEDCEIFHSKCCGISLGKYLQPENENKWTLKKWKDGTQTERDAICQAQREGWTKEKIGSHIVRRCNIHHCEQTGIVGHMGGTFSVIEDNDIHHINTKQQIFGAEIAGIKMHAAIDTVIRRNHIHHCTRGIWLDWQAQGTRVTQNFFHDNTPPEWVEPTYWLFSTEDLFIEVSHGPTLVDNNVFLSPVTGRLAAQGIAFVHNLICGVFTCVGEGTNNCGGEGSQDARYTPYHVPHRTEIAGFMTILHGDDRFYNNIFVQCKMPEYFYKYAELVHEKCVDTAGLHPFNGYPTYEEYYDLMIVQEPVPGDSSRYYSHLPVFTGGNVYFNGATPFDKEKNCTVDTEHKVTVNLTEKASGLYVLHTDLYEYLPTGCGQFISTEILGKAFEPEQKFENPDGSQIIFDRDYFGEKRSLYPSAGPFADGSVLKRKTLN